MNASTLLGLGLIGCMVVACSSKNGDVAGGTDGGGAPTAGDCADGVLDGTETGIDCGGTCRACDGATCTQATDCASNVCNTVCGPSAGKTCGVGLPTACADGQPCQQDTDCTSDYCNGTCAEPPADVHSDGRRDGGETGVDCGGTAPTPCPAGQGCKSDSDCEGTCDLASSTCQAPSATDGKKDQGETDVDCGGSNAPPCALGKVCVTNGDCQLDACIGGACVMPTSTDGLQNGGETDVDCGGTGVTDGTHTYTAPRCKDGQKCAIGSDCVSAGCSPTAGVCIAPSCATATTAGITTCGAGETGTAAAVHESCCRSLTLPTRTTWRLDRYEITSGRMRTFLTTAGPNVRAWVASYIAANPTSQLATLANMGITGPMPAQANKVLNLYPSTNDPSVPLNLVAQMGFDLDDYDGIRGCYNGTGNGSENTYWQDATSLSAYGLPPRVTPQSESDQKPLNCAMPMMFAAFCAWDGGQLATNADELDAWGTATYPWGATNEGRHDYDWCNGTYKTGGFTCQDTTYTNPITGEVGVFYEWPLGIDPLNDSEQWIAGPGRMTKDATTATSGGATWQDLYANLVEYTGDFAASVSDFCEFSEGPAAGVQTCTRSNKPGYTGTHYTGVPTARLLGVSWEGHQYPRNNTSAYPVTFQYGKFGGRCVRPVQ